MKRRSFFVIALLASSLVINAQEKEKKVVTDSYDRNSLSVIVVTRGDSYDSQSINFSKELAIDDKFDSNLINTKTIRIDKSREIALEQTEADELINSANIAKEVLGFIFNRKSDGSMDDALIRQRGLYNAKDQDIINASAAKINEQYLEWGEKLVSSSYVILIDYTNIQLETSDNERQYTTDATAFAYKIDCPKEKLEEFYTTAWADASSTQTQKKDAMEAFDNMELNMIPIANVKTSNLNMNATMSSLGSSIKGIGSAINAAKVEEPTNDTQATEITTAKFAENSLEAAFNDAYYGVMAKLEKAIPEWQVAVSIISTRPLMAKIGKKEGVKNGLRFQAYSYSENRDGELVSHKKGYLRATKVTDNRGNATGSTQPSEFYQISGVANIQDGWTIKQKNDLKIGTTITYKIGGLFSSSPNLNFDYLINISNLASTYGLLSIGTDFSLLGHELFDEYKISNLNFAIGAGWGLHATRFFEIMPYAMIGGDYMTAANYDGDDAIALYLEPGARISYQFAYPCSLFVKFGYDILFNGHDESTIYGIINDSLSENDQHDSGSFVEIGFKFTF